MNEKGTNFCSFPVGLEPATPAYEAVTQSIPPYHYLLVSVNCPQGVTIEHPSRIQPDRSGVSVWYAAQSSQLLSG